MKKTISFFLILIFSVFTSSSQEVNAFDLVVFFDTSRSLFEYYQDISDYASGPLLNDYLRYGDTLHLLSFSDQINIQISRKISNIDDLEIAIGRMLLMYPVNKYTDFALTFDFISDYIGRLPLSRKKTVIVLSDGIHDPPTDSKLSNISTSTINNRIMELSEKLNDNNTSFHFIQFPLLKESNQTSHSPNNDLKSILTSNSNNDSIKNDSPTDILVENNIRPKDQNNKTDFSSTQKTDIFENSLHKNKIQSINNTAIEKPDNIKMSENNTPIYDKINTSKDTKKDNQNITISNNQELTVDSSEGINNDLLENNAFENKKSPDIIEKKMDAKVPSQNIINMDDFNIFPIIPKIILVIIVLLFLALITAFIIIRKVNRMKNHLPYIPTKYKNKINPSDDRKYLFESSKPENMNSVTINIKHSDNNIHFFNQTNESNSNIESKIKFFKTNSPFRINNIINKAYYLEENKIKPSKFIQLKIFVEDQNTNIGRRNIHVMKSGIKFSVGGGRSNFIIFLVPVPYKIAEIYFTGEECIFIPRYVEYFPELMNQPLFDCIGKDIQIISQNGHKLKIRFDRFEDPLIRLNQILHSIESPGIKDF